MDSMTQIINHMIAGSFPISINEIICRGRLIALEKKDGGVGPLAIGYLFKRLVAICANHYVIARRSESLTPIQLGIGVPGGAEAAVHAKRRLLLQPPTDHVVVKLDFTNAFDSVRRDLSLETTATNFTDLCIATYSGDRILSYGSHQFRSREGFQQTDFRGIHSYQAGRQDIIWCPSSQTSGQRPSINRQNLRPYKSH